VHEWLSTGFWIEIGFTDHLQVVTTSNYNTIANFHILQITTAHAKSYGSDVTSRFPVTGLNNGDSSTAPTKSSLHRLPYNWLTSNSLVREREREKKRSWGGSERHYIAGGGKKLYLRFWRFPGSARLSFWYRERILAEFCSIYIIYMTPEGLH
jgi:hypothetical protein